MHFPDDDGRAVRRGRKWPRGKARPEPETDAHPGEPDPRCADKELAGEEHGHARRDVVPGKQKPVVGGQVLEIGRVLRRRRQLEDKGREHVQRRVGGLEEGIDPEQPGPPVPAPGPQQQTRVGGVPDELGRHEDGHLTVHAVVVAPSPRQQQQRGRHLEAGDGDQRVDGAGRLNRLRRLARHRAARQYPLDDAQVFDLRAIGARGQPGASLPLHRLVQRERVGHVAYQIVTVVGAHRSAGLPLLRRAAPALAHGARPAEYVSYDVCRGGTGRVPRGGPPARARARRRAGRYRREASGMTALSRMTARLSALRAASGLGRRSMAASCA